jgi:hypothetical protein
MGIKKRFAPQQGYSLDVQSLFPGCDPFNEIICRKGTAIVVIGQMVAAVAK